MRHPALPKPEGGVYRDAVPFFCSLLLLAFILAGFSVVMLGDVQQLRSDSAVIHSCGQRAVFVSFHSEIARSEGHEATSR